MSKPIVKVKIESLLGDKYKNSWSIMRLKDGTTPEQVAQLLHKLGLLHSTRSGNHYTRIVETYEFILFEEKPVRKHHHRPMTDEEKQIAAAKRALAKARRKIEKQKHTVLDFHDLETMKLQRIMAEIQEFFDAAPDDPTHWDLILITLADIAILNADEAMDFEKYLPEDFLRPIIQHIYAAKPEQWTQMMMTSLRHYRNLFKGDRWHALKKIFNQLAKEYAVEFYPEALAAGITEMSRKESDAVQDQWDILRRVPFRLFFEES